jgi:hypothetical protein
VAARACAGAELVPDLCVTTAAQKKLVLAARNDVMRRDAAAANQSKTRLFVAECIPPWPESDRGAPRCCAALPAAHGAGVTPRAVRRAPLQDLPGATGLHRSTADRLQPAYAPPPGRVGLRPLAGVAGASLSVCVLASSSRVDYPTVSYTLPSPIIADVPGEGANENSAPKGDYLRLQCASQQLPLRVERTCTL